MATTGAAFMGLSVQCARCHDHKFDPITSEDFYGMIAFFNSNEEPGIYAQSTDAYRSLEPSIDVPTPEQTKQLADVKQTLVALTAERDQATPEEAQEFDNYRATFISPTELEWVTAPIVAAESTHGSTMTIQPDGSVLASGITPPTINIF